MPFQLSVRGKASSPQRVPLDEYSETGTPLLLRKVLVVDDETDLADVTSLLLSAHGLDIVTVYSAQQALHQLEQDDQIGAVVSDIVMPGMNGLQLGDAIRERYPRVKIVLVSGFTLPHEFDGRERPYLFAAKPYKIDILLGLLHS